MVLIKVNGQREQLPQIRLFVRPRLWFKLPWNLKNYPNSYSSWQNLLVLWIQESINSRSGSFWNISVLLNSTRINDSPKQSADSYWKSFSHWFLSTFSDLRIIQISFFSQTLGKLINISSQQKNSIIDQVLAYLLISCSPNRIGLIFHSSRLTCKRNIHLLSGVLWLNIFLPFLISTISVLFVLIITLISSALSFNGDISKCE